MAVAVQMEQSIVMEIGMAARRELEGLSWTRLSAGPGTPRGFQFSGSMGLQGQENLLLHKLLQKGCLLLAV